MHTENKSDSPDSHRGRITAGKIHDEAIRYMENAHSDLKLAKKNGKYYQDVKYLRSACGIAYIGMLKAIQGIFLLRNIPKPKKHPNIEYYQEGLSKIDKKMLTSLNTAYHILHIYGYYDGFNHVPTIASGFEEATSIIYKLKQSL